MKFVYNFSPEQVSLPQDMDIMTTSLSSPFFSDGSSPLSLDNTSESYEALAQTAEADLRSLLNIPISYKVLFMLGGAEAQYAAIPLNLLSDHRCADYIVTGAQSKKAYLEGKRYGDMAIAASSAGYVPAFSTIPDTKRSDFRPDADYVHICYNNPHFGTRFHKTPDTGNIPLVADVSSCFLSEPLQISDFGMLYADLRLCLLPAGMTVVIVRSDLLGSPREATPSVLDYRTVLTEGHAFHSPSALCLYTASCLFRRMLDMGGLEEIKRRGERKASLLYDYLDSQTYYTAPADKKYRSMTNVVFTTGNGVMDERLADMAEAEGLLCLRPHTSSHGLCAALQFAMPYEGVEALVKFMKRFAFENPKLLI